MIRPAEPQPPVTSPAGDRILNAFTVDVEDYFQVANFENVVSRRCWADYPSRVVGNTTRILDLLDEHGVKGTFFVLGWVARRHPELVREIASRAHEIGSHGYWHRLIYRQSPRQFLADLRRSRRLLEDITGRQVTAYRAPSFSVTSQSLWALDILSDEGFSVDSSVFPIRHHRYGIPGAQVGPHRLPSSAGPLWEFPPPVVRWMGLNIPVGGGGYFRLYPIALTTYYLRQINRAKRPFVFYVHPWELDPEQPPICGASRLGRFRHYVNLSQTAKRLAQLLESFRFGSIAKAVAQAKLGSDPFARAAHASPRDSAVESTT